MPEPALNLVDPERLGLDADALEGLARRAIVHFRQARFQDVVTNVELLASFGYVTPTLTLVSAVAESELGNPARAIELMSAAKKFAESLDPKSDERRAH